MVKITFLYPNAPGTRFDVAYYAGTHMGLVQAKLGPLGLRSTQVERGINASVTGTPPPFHCIGHLLFESMAAYGAAMQAHGKELAADVPNFTDTQPIVQHSEPVE